MVYDAEKVYTIPERAAVSEKTETFTFSMQMAGDYIIGEAPKDYVTGEEKEFITSQSGNYTAGEDFPAGTYDLEAIEGGGNVQGSGLNEIMGVNKDFDMYVKKLLWSRSKRRKNTKIERSRFKNQE